jgi:hypothetical protein
MSTPTETAHVDTFRHIEALQAENAELRAEAERYKGFANDAGNRALDLEARATAAEGERDRLRELVERAARALADWLKNGAPNHPHRDGCACMLCESQSIVALAAIPHTEGEASAPPKSKEPG